MILVTGASGKTGQAVVRALSKRGLDVRALTRSTTRDGSIAVQGAAETYAGDLLDVDGLLPALSGVRAVYLIAPNVHPEEERIGQTMIEAARRAGTERLVYHSVLHPQTRSMPHHWQKLAVEERLLASGLEFTVLQPGAYMQNLLAYWETIVAQGVYRVPYGEGGALSLVDLEDVAAVAARVLTETVHEGATYELAGPESLSPSQIAEALARTLGRSVRAESLSVSEWAADAASRGLGAYSIDALSKMFEYYDRFGLQGNPSVLGWLLGRDPTSLEEFLDRHLRSI